MRPLRSLPALGAAVSWLALAAALVGACVPTFDDDLAVVRAPRVVGVRAVPAEAAPGTAVALEALVVAPDGDGDAARDALVWGVCRARKPLTELGPVAQVCVTDLPRGGPAVTLLGRGARATATVSADACRSFGPLQPPADASGVAGRAVDPDVTGGYHQPVLAALGDEVTLGTVRLACGPSGLPNAETVRFNQGYRPNENPALERVELEVAGARRSVVPGEPGAAPLRVPAGSEVTLRAVWPACPREPVCGDGLCTAGENATACAADCRDAPKGCAGSERYLWANPLTRVVEPRREGLTVAWYAAAGRFASEQTGRAEPDPDGTDATNVWTAPATPGAVPLWIVLRDDRGGVAFYPLRVDVGP